VTLSIRFVPRLGLALLLAAAVALSLAAACTKGSDRRGGDPEMNAEKTESAESLGRELGVSLPANARVVGVHREAGIDGLIAVKIELPTADARAVLDSSPIDKAAMRPGSRGFLGPDRDNWWDPSKAPGLRTGQAPLDGGRFLNIGVSERGATTFLYLVTHGT
jgi:hypothetical protein